MENVKPKPYPEYKPFGLSWLGHIPTHWDEKPGFAIFIEKHDPNTGMKERRVLSLSYGRIVVKPEEKLRGLVPESFETYQVVNPGEIIIRSTDLQNDLNSLRVGLVRDRGIITSAYLCLHSRGLLTNEYAFLLLHAYDLKKFLYGLGSGLRQNLAFSDFKRLPIPVPSIPEQETIVRYVRALDQKIEHYIQLKKKAITAFNEQKQVIIRDAVTLGLNQNAQLKSTDDAWLSHVPSHWEVAKIGQKVQILRGRFSHRPRNAPEFYDGNYPFIQTGDISAADKYINTYSQTLNERGFAISKLFRAGTIAMVITGAKTGHIAILNFDACFPDSAVGFFPRKAIVNTAFLYYVLLALKGELDRSAITSTQENLNLQRIRSQIAAWPPIEEQMEIANRLDRELTSQDKAIARSKAEINLLREYRKRLIADIVTGHLDVHEVASHLPDAVQGSDMNQHGVVSTEEEDSEEVE